MLSHRSLVANVFFAVGLGLFLVVYALRGPDDFPGAAFLSAPIVAAIFTYDRAKKDRSSEPGRLALTASAKVLALVFVAWLIVVELHGPLADIDTLHDAEPTLTVVGFLFLGSGVLIAAPSVRARLRVLMFLGTIAFLGLAAIAAGTSGFGFRFTLVFAAVAAALAVGGYVLARRDPDAM